MELQAIQNAAIQKCAIVSDLILWLGGGQSGKHDLPIWTTIVGATFTAIGTQEVWMVNLIARLLTLFVAIALTLEPCVSSYASNFQLDTSQASTTSITTPDSEIPNCHHVFRSHLAVVRAAETDQTWYGADGPETDKVGVAQQSVYFADSAAKVSGKFRLVYGSGVYLTSRDRLNWLCRLLN